MDCVSAPCPDWMARHILEAGGRIPFRQFMDWALNDPDHGSYGSGVIRIGNKGDFVTSPSLSSDFAELLGVQVLQWLHQLDSIEKEIETDTDSRLSIVELGPGEGHLTRDLIASLQILAPELLKRVDFILVEPNLGMVKYQQNLLDQFVGLVSVKWSSYIDLVKDPVVGIVIAHEVLDVLPVDRIVSRRNELFQQGIVITKKNDKYHISFKDLSLTDLNNYSINELKSFTGLDIPPQNASDGWTTELHSSLDEWFKETSKCLIKGNLLIIDYALEARRYYSSLRSSGTLISYKNNVANNQILIDPGLTDITAHLCLESVICYAEKNKWEFIGEARQGQALLALGLASKLSSLKDFDGDNLSLALSKREALLRLVDPAGLGEFRWMAFRINLSSFDTRFLEEPKY